MNYNDPVAQFLNNVDAVIAAGVTLPTEFTELRARCNRFTVKVSPCRDRLRAELINPTGDVDLDILRAAAIIESEKEPHKLNAVVRQWMYLRLSEIYTAVETDSYTLIASNFDKLAKQFSTVVSTVDVTADPATLMAGPERQRKAWVEAELLAQQLTDSIPGLQAAATLAGIDAQRSEGLIALVCDLSGVPGKTAWTSWWSEGRCGRWAALAAAGIPIRAAALADFTPYDKDIADTGQPEPLEPINPRRNGGSMAAV